MFKLSRLAIATSLVFACATPGFAYTPESGLYWNPAEPGTGVQIEIQDNFLFLTGYLFLADGSPTFVTVQGYLDDGAMRFSSTGNPADGSSVNTFRGGQCLGCVYSGPPQIFAGSAGPVLLEFDPQDETRAMITWGGRTTSIQRYQFGLVRQSDSQPVAVTKMLGEWNATIDFSQNVNNLGRRFDGDVLVVDQVDGVQAAAVFTFEGCRPEDSLLGFCSDLAFENDELAGRIDELSGRHLMVVKNSRPDGTGSDTCLLYDVRVGSNDFAGGLDGNLDGSNDGGLTSYRCGAADVMQLDAYPVRGFRSASRSFVEDGTGPSKLETALAAAPRLFPASALRSKTKPLSSAQQATLTRRTAQVRELEQRLEQR